MKSRDSSEGSLAESSLVARARDAPSGLSRDRRRRQREPGLRSRSRPAATAFSVRACCPAVPRVRGRCGATLRSPGTPRPAASMPPPRPAHVAASQDACSSGPRPCSRVARDLSSERRLCCHRPSEPVCVSRRPRELLSRVGAVPSSTVRWFFFFLMCLHFLCLFCKIS